MRMRSENETAKIILTGDRFIVRKDVKRQGYLNNGRSS
jgi:hypothetical protein